MSDEKGPDEKVICVPLNDPTWERLSDIHDVPAGLRDEIEHFFQVYKDLEHKGTVVTHGFGNRAEADEVIASARERLPRSPLTGGAGSAAAARRCYAPQPPARAWFGAPPTAGIFERPRPAPGSRAAG